ncbi:MAG: hydrogenase formation protein HypD [Tannerellaceae bacterium]|jgi:hydrogenase expression/formation protein HypD|nr:hydrogenase formation protein HypD [Tannerellaceae bacterium]
MRYTVEYRNKEHITGLTRAISQMTTRAWRIMEICGGQTHAIARYRLEDMLPHGIRLLHGPGCPVCVTPEGLVDCAIALATDSGATLATFGDMMRVPGSRGTLMEARAEGADVRVMYAPLDAVALAAATPGREVVFFAIGFETTLAAHLAALSEAVRRGLGNFSLLTSFFTVPPAMEAILSDPSCEVDAFLAAGHVCAVTGYAGYRRIAETFARPVVVTGFEPADLLYGIYHSVRLLEGGETRAVVNAYRRAVSEEGNLRQQALINEMLEPSDGEWRGIGLLPSGCLRLRKPYEGYDAIVKFALRDAAGERTSASATGCMAGEIMLGKKLPAECPHFGADCLPDHPAGAPMASTEGVCAAYYRYRTSKTINI